MNFDYLQPWVFPGHQKIKRQIAVPWIRFGIYNPENPDKKIFIYGLADSGSDLTIVSRDIADYLGYEINEKKGVKIAGVGGGMIEGYAREVGLIIEDTKNKDKTIEYATKIVFSKVKFPQSMPNQSAILGTIGFFTHLNVTFKCPLITIEEKPKRKE